MKIIECTQGTPEWNMARIGMITASRFDDVKALNKTRDGYGNTRYDYMLQLKAERRFNRLMPNKRTTAAMERGTQLEAEAREKYEADYEVEVQQVGFIALDDWIGCSPDGLIGEDGLLEIKCPLETTFIKHEETGFLVGDYKYQTQGQLWVSGRQWCDFEVYCQGEKPIVTRLYRNEEYIKMLETEVNKFKEELQKYIENYQKAGF